MSEQKYAAGDILYEIGTEAEVFYMLRSGRLGINFEALLWI